MIKSVNSCLNCENLVESLKCVKHNLSVQIDNVCEDHSIKKAFSKKGYPKCKVTQDGTIVWFSRKDKPVTQFKLPKINPIKQTHTTMVGFKQSWKHLLETPIVYTSLESSELIKLTDIYVITIR